MFIIFQYLFKFLVLESGLNLASRHSQPKPVGALPVGGMFFISPIGLNQIAITKVPVHQLVDLLPVIPDLRRNQDQVLLGHQPVRHFREQILTDAVFNMVRTSVQNLTPYIISV